MNWIECLPKISGAALVLVITLLFCACEQDVTEPAIVEDGDISTVARAIYASRSVNFNNRSDGTYTSTEAAEDFGNAGGWNDSRAYNSGGTCRIAVLKNALGSASGMLSQIDVSDGDEYQLNFSIKFHSTFEWAKGGKVGFGFYIGEGNTGCDPATDGNGGSMRIMWNQDGAGNVTLRPYLYYYDMTTPCGYGFGKKYPATGTISRQVWYNVELYMKSNTGSNTDGHVRVVINGTNVLDQSIRWTTNDSQRLMRKLFFHTFRGGSTADWHASTDSYIYFDNVSWNRISS